jgi:hypothetical protein
LAEIFQLHSEELLQKWILSASFLGSIAMKSGINGSHEDIKAVTVDGFEHDTVAFSSM